MEELLFDNVMDGESLVKDILNTDGVSSITDDDGKSYWWNTIDKTRNYQTAPLGTLNKVFITLPCSFIVD